MLSRAGSVEPCPIPGYRLLRPLACGGMGRVFLGEHRESGLAVAIKVIDAETASIAHSGARLVNEARLLGRINHPHVVTVYDYGRLEDGSFYQVMEYVSGEELSSLMRRRGRFTALELLPFIKKVCLALHASHSARVVHRDLKPQNIVITCEQPLGLKILDFGIALDLDEALDEPIDPQMILGTPLFISPEQLRSQGRVGPAADIYSLGVLLYWMLAGRPPFVGDTLVQLLAAHLMQRVPQLLDVAPEISPAVAHLVHHCLEKDPDKRPADALQLAKAFSEAILEGARPDAAALALGHAPGWAAFPQLAETDPLSDFDEPPTAVSEMPAWGPSFDDEWLLSAEFSAPTILQPDVAARAALAEYADEPTVVDGASAGFWGTGLSSPTSIDLELHMASTLILEKGRRRSRSRTPRWLQRLIPWRAAA